MRKPSTKKHLIFLPYTSFITLFFCYFLRKRKTKQMHVFNYFNMQFTWNEMHLVCVCVLCEWFNISDCLTIIVQFRLQDKIRRFKEKCMRRRLKWFSHNMIKYLVTLCYSNTCLMSIVEVFLCSVSVCNYVYVRMDKQDKVCIKKSHKYTR